MSINVDVSVQNHSQSVILIIRNIDELDSILCTADVSECTCLAALQPHLLACGRTSGGTRQ